MKSILLLLLALFITPPGITPKPLEAPPTTCLAQWESFWPSGSVTASCFVNQSSGQSIADFEAAILATQRSTFAVLPADGGTWAAYWCTGGGVEHETATPDPPEAFEVTILRELRQTLAANTPDCGCTLP